MNSLIALINALTAPVSLSALKAALLAITARTRVYEVYTALISQSTTDAPTSIVLENTTGATITFGYISAGVYSINATGLFVLDKVFVITRPSSSGDLIEVIRVSANQLVINTVSDDVLDKSELEIRIYE
jgi:hypothetical protein